MLLLAPWLWFDDGSGGVWGPPPGCRGSIDLASYAQIAEALPGQPRGWGLFLCDEIPVDLADNGGIVLSSEDPRDARLDGKLLGAWETILGWRPAGDTIATNLWDHLTAGSDPTNEDRTGMLVPGVDGRLQLWFGGLIREERFVYGAHPHTAKLKELLQRQLNAIRNDALAGKLVSPVTRQPDFEYHLRIADALLEKYAGTNPSLKAELFVELKPDSWLADEEPLAHATTISDSFNRSDADALGSSSEGWSWTETLGDIDIVSNTARNGGTAAANRARAETDLSSADHYAQALCAADNDAASTFTGPCVRYASGADTCYDLEGRWNADNLRLNKVVTGTATVLGSSPALTLTPGTTYTLKLQISGTTLSSHADDVQKESITDTAIDGTTVGGKRTGIYLRQATAGKFASVDDFTASDLAAAGVTYPQLERGVRGLNRGLCTGMRS